MLEFKEELLSIWDRIINWENITVARYGDWEHMLMDWVSVWPWTQATEVDKRSSTWMTLLWEDLKKTLDVVSDNFYYAIPCQCCNVKGKEWYIENLKSKNYTFANLFINSNYETFKLLLQILQEEVVLIWNVDWIWRKYPFKIKEYIWIPNDCVNYYQENKEAILQEARELATKYNNRLFMISAWPLANIIVYEMYKANPNNQYLDVWSALDERTHWKITRWFQRPEDYYAQRHCIF